MLIIALNQSLNEPLTQRTRPSFTASNRWQSRWRAFCHPIDPEGANSWGKMAVVASRVKNS